MVKFDIIQNRQNKEVFIVNNYNRKAVENYKKRNNYKKLTIERPKEEIDNIRDYCKNMGISTTEFVVKCCSYFIIKNELPPD